MNSGSLGCFGAGFLLGSPGFLLVYLLLFLDKLLLRPAALPAVLPIADQELEAESVNLHARLETNTKVAVVHLVLIDIRV